MRGNLWVSTNVYWVKTHVLLRPSNFNKYVKRTLKKKHAAQRLLKRNEVAKHLGVRVETVSRWTTAGTLPCVRIGKRSVRYLLPQIMNRLISRNKGGHK